MSESQAVASVPECAETPRIHYFSPTQIDTFLLCPRKWAWGYIAKLKGPQHASAALGSLIHTLLENYLRTGEALPLSDPDPQVRLAASIAVSGLHLIPKPQTLGMVIESEDTATPGDERAGFKFQSGGHWYTGKKDIEISGPHAAEPGIPEVWDHKSSGDLRWAKTPADLREDPQALIYAYESMQKHGTDAVNLNWVYYQTRGTRKAKRVHLRLTRDHVEPLFFGMSPVVATMASSLLEKRDPLTIPGDTSACEAFGGCAYRERCAPHITPVERMRAMMGQTAAGLLAKLNARKEQMGAPASATPAAAPSAPATGGAAALLAKMKANGVGIGNTPPAVIAAADVPRAQRTPEQQKLIDDRTAEVDASCGMPAINPPEQMSEEQFKAESAKPEPAPKAEPKGRGGRKPGSKNKPKEAPVVEETPVATEDDLVAVMGAEAAGGATLEDVEEVISRMPPPAIEKTFEPPPVIEARFKLFVDCLPMGADVVHFEEIVVDANARILASHGLADYRFAQFGQGPAIFQQTLRDMVAAGEITGNVVVSSRTPEGGLAMAPLAPLAAFPVVRGLG